MDDKRTILIWSGLFGIMVAIFFMNNWIKSQMEENPMPSQQIVRPAAPAANVQPSSGAVDLSSEPAMAENSPAVNPQDSAKSQEEAAAAQDIVYETPLISPILQQ